jgi:hypothetical protein
VAQPTWAVEAKVLTFAAWTALDVVLDADLAGEGCRMDTSCGILAWVRADVGGVLGTARWMTVGIYKNVQCQQTAKRVAWYGRELLTAVVH